jgi:hypothetical protein
LTLGGLDYGENKAHAGKEEFLIQDAGQEESMFFSD